MSVFFIACSQAVIIYTARRVVHLVSSPASGGIGMDKVSSTGKVSRHQIRLRMQLKMLILVCVVFGTGDGFTLAVLGVWAVYGSFPYLFIGWSLQFIFCWASFPLSFSMLSRLPASPNLREEQTDTPHSLERRGVETIVIRNAIIPTSKMLRKKIVGSRRKMSSNLQNPQLLSKIVEEQSQIESQTTPKSWKKTSCFVLWTHLLTLIL